MLNDFGLKRLILVINCTHGRKSILIVNRAIDSGGGVVT